MARSLFRAAFFVLIVLWASLNSGCLHYGMNGSQSTPARPAPPVELPEARAGALAHKEKVLEESRAYTVKRIELQAANNLFDLERKIALDCYQPNLEGARPAILILPISGGDYQLERYLAGYFAKRGLAAIIARRDEREYTKLIPSLEDLNRLLKQSVLDNEQIIDWMSARKELDAQRIGVLGVSQGAVKGSLLLPYEDRIQAAVLALAGGDIPYILLNSTEKGIVKHRSAALQKHDLTPEEFSRQVREIVTFDPINLAPSIDREKVLLILARFDSVVPFEKGWELREKMGEPETIVLPAGHYSSVVFLPHIRREAFEFFQLKFEEVHNLKPETAKIQE